MKTLQHRFVEFIPDKLEDDILYISLDYCTATHKCMCGCGNEVVTPLSPTDWELTFNGETVSLYPSIGNWNFKCKSHYWITKNRVRHARMWSEKEIDSGRERDTQKKNKYFNRDN
ncbi:MAG: DUF6527 family protein [Bacteroidetes bacterium]|nr:DUF6527 family protein [Bacteroidota bacterium]